MSRLGPGAGGAREPGDSPRLRNRSVACGPWSPSRPGTPATRRARPPARRRRQDRRSPSRCRPPAQAARRHDPGGARRGRGRPHLERAAQRHDRWHAAPARRGRRTAAAGHRRIMRRAAVPVGAIELAQIDLRDHIDHQPREVILIQPLAQARRQQQLLLAIASQEVLLHAQSLLTTPDTTKPAEAGFARQAQMRGFLVPGGASRSRLRRAAVGASAKQCQDPPYPQGAEGAELQR